MAQIIAKTLHLCTVVVKKLYVVGWYISLLPVGLVRTVGLPLCFLGPRMVLTAIGADLFLPNGCQLGLAAVPYLAISGVLPHMKPTTAAHSRAAGSSKASQSKLTQLAMLSSRT